ncbi:MAG TPA: MMPL family transporter [Dermatophilaceae bacterium]|nr:MMPL family transporter [Dermatophilaceae bacterium]
MTSWARWSVGHPVVVTVVWLLMIVGAQAGAWGVGSDFRNSFALPGTDSQAAVDLLHREFPGMSGDTDTIVVATDGIPVNVPAVRDRVQPLLDQVAGLESVTAVRSPYAPTGAGQVSADGTIAYASVQYATSGVGVPRADLEHLTAMVDAASADGLDIAVGGQGVANLARPKIGPAELVGVAVAALILLLAFRSPVAMILPIASAGAALGVATGVVRLTSNVTTVSDVAPVLGVLLGLGVGIDYALFIVNRHRGNLRAGMPVRSSILAALDTSGRAVVFAGATVVIALLGLFLTGIEFLYGLAIGAGVSVVFTVLAATTLVPALLGVLGVRVLGRRERRALAAGELAPEHSGGVFGRWARLVERRPVVLLVLAVGLLLTIAIPASGIRLGTADQGNDPVGTTTRQAYDALAEGFGPGINGPLVLAVDLSEHPLQAGDRALLQPLLARLKADPGVASVVGPMPSADGTAALFRVVPTTSPQDQATSDLIDRVRTQVAPETAATSGARIHVGGPTATFDDFATKVQATIPLFVSVVVALSLLLLMLVFRSLLVPLVGAVMNLLSVAAAFGVVVAVFQWGWGSDVIGLGKAGPIEPFLPVVLFAMLFGLSVDYQVFLVSRMHEEWLRTGDNATAVRTGHADTGTVIVAAATIMVFVFGAFVFGDSRTVKLMGLGMASAVLLDAFVIRMLIVPAVMYRIGPANWWLPRWLDRVLPAVTVEGRDVEHPEPARVQERIAFAVPAGTEHARDHPPASTPDGEHRD